MLKRPWPYIIRPAVACNVANVVEDDGVLLAWRWPQDPANLLQLKPQGLSGPEQDGTTCCWDVKALAHHVNSDQDAGLTSGESADYGITV